MRLKLKFNMCFLFVLTTFIILNVSIVISSLNKERIQNKYFRLHVVANSNSIADQNLKLLVAKNISNYLCKLYNEGFMGNKDEAKNIVMKNMDKIIEIADNTIKSNGYSYNIHSDIGKISYDEKESTAIQMTKGTYDSIRVVIGSGNRQEFLVINIP